MVSSPFTVNKNPTATELSKFGWSMAVGFGVLGGLLWLIPAWRLGDSGALDWSASKPQMTAACFWFLGLSLLAVTKASPIVAKPVYVVWMSVAVRIGMVMSTIMLSLLFLLLLPVFSLVVRLGDPLRKRLHSGGTYWEDHKSFDATLERMRRPF